MYPPKIRLLAFATEKYLKNRRDKSKIKRFSFTLTINPDSRLSAGLWQLKQILSIQNQSKITVRLFWQQFSQETKCMCTITAWSKLFVIIKY